MSGDVRSLEEVIGAQLGPLDRDMELRAQVIAAAVREWCLAPQQIAAAMESLGHYECNDGWYSCPKSTEGCSDSEQGDECNCALEARARAVLQAVMGDTPP